MNMRRVDYVRIALILSLLVTVMIAGCGYQLQGRADLPFKEVAIGEIKNVTSEPKLQDRMHRLLAETFMEYGVDVRNSSRYRIEGSINKFQVWPVAEKDLKAVEYQLLIAGNFKVVDTESRKESAKPGIKTTATTIVGTKDTDDKKVEYKAENIGDISNPYFTYFRSTGLLVNVLAEKEIATEKAIKDLSQELVLRIIYKLPKADDKIKKGEQKVEPKTVPAGNR
jgi:outer membrane lipopolysaccharide assembly protein LptE/RlpB